MAIYGLALQRDADTAISNNEREFIVKVSGRGRAYPTGGARPAAAAHALRHVPPPPPAPAPAAAACAPHLWRCPYYLQALQQGQRIDGRGPFELRAVRFQFALDDSACTVALGRTRVMAVVGAALDAPFADRHNEGSLRFNVEFSPMASPAFEPFGARSWGDRRGVACGGVGRMLPAAATQLSNLLPPLSAPQGGPARTPSRWLVWWSAGCVRAAPSISRRLWCWRVGGLRGGAVPVQGCAGLLGPAPIHPPLRRQAVGPWEAAAAGWDAPGRVHTPLTGAGRRPRRPQGVAPAGGHSCVGPSRQPGRRLRPGRAGRAHGLPAARRHRGRRRRRPGARAVRSVASLLHAWPSCPASVPRDCVVLPCSLTRARPPARPLPGCHGAPTRAAGAGAAVHPPPAPAHHLCAVRGELRGWAGAGVAQGWRAPSAARSSSGSPLSLAPAGPSAAASCHPPCRRASCWRWTLRSRRRRPRTGASQVPG